MALIATTCKGCGRVVYVSDVDAAGLCIFCAQADEDAQPSSLTDPAAEGQAEQPNEMESDGH